MGNRFDNAVGAIGRTPLVRINRIINAPATVYGKCEYHNPLSSVKDDYLTDFGKAGVAEFPVYDMDGQWIVEGHGVAPTIEVDNLPHATYEGYDAQLQAAIQYLQQKIEEEPIPTLDAKPFPEYGQSAQDIVN